MSGDHTARIWDLSSESRTYDEIAKLIRCHIPASFEREGSNLIIFRMPTPAEYQQDLPKGPNFNAVRPDRRVPVEDAASKEALAPIDKLKASGLSRRQGSTL